MTRPHRARARRLPGRHRARRSDENFVALGRRRRCCPSRVASCSSRKATSPRSAAKPCEIFDQHGNTVQRAVRESELSADAAEKGDYPHFMLKEIHEQPRAVAQTLDGARGRRQAARGRVRSRARQAVFAKTEAVHIVACGTSYHAGVVAQVLHRADLPPAVLGRDRERIPLSQPRRAEEHAVRQRLAVGRNRRHARRAAAWRSRRGYLSQLAICNVPESSLVRESELVMLTRAGPEIGVASTKAFTTQLAALGMLVVALREVPQRRRRARARAWCSGSSAFRR